MHGRLFYVENSVEGCKNGSYGFSCSMKCSHCKMGTNCNNTTGICEAGCEEHWREPKCDGNFFFQFYFNDN